MIRSTVSYPISYRIRYEISNLITHPISYRSGNRYRGRILPSRPVPTRPNGSQAPASRSASLRVYRRSTAANCPLTLRT